MQSLSFLPSFVLVSIFLTWLAPALTAQNPEARARITQAVNAQQRVTLQGNIHPLARPEYDRGPAPDDLPIQRTLLVLKRSDEQEADLRRLLDEQQTKASPNFHKWLTPEEFGQRFGPTDSDIQAVTDWLAGEGFQVKRVAAGRTVIEFSGSAGLVRDNLHTEIHRFVVNGEAHWANVSNPQIPAALAPVVAGIASLNNFPKEPLHHSLGTFTWTKATGEVQPLFTTYTTPPYYLLGPTDFATIYNVLPLWNSGTDGSGQTIAIVAASNINIEDARDFRSMFGLPPNDPNIILNGPDPGNLGGGYEGEADLDVQWAGAVARNATIDLVVSETTEATHGIDLSSLYIVDNNLAPVMSVSYGACEAYLTNAGNFFYSNLWEQAAAQGITVLVASGDMGSATCDGFGLAPAAEFGLAVSGQASTPFNVAVGGTDFNDSNVWSTYWNPSNNSITQSSAKSYIPETTWNDSCARFGTPVSCSSVSEYGEDLVAGGGGPSNCVNSSGAYPNIMCSGGYPKPPWQTGASVPNDGVRDLPDVSLFSGTGLNHTLYVLCQMDANPYIGGSSYSCDLNTSYTDFQAAGGTSASAQVFAGIMALVTQKHGRQGNANYILYRLAAKSGASCTSAAAAVSNASCIFYDINNKMGSSNNNSNNSVACVHQSPNCSNQTASGYGILVVNPAATSPVAAWMTGAGYDLATGLGSVNAANLVNNWTSVSFTPSTTTLSLSPTTLTHGQAANLTIQVTPSSGSGTPTGDVSLIAQTSNSQNNSSTTSAGYFTLSGGSFSGTTSLLPGGTYGVTAHYAGDGTYGASDSTPPVQVTVNKESSLTSLRLVTFDYNTGASTYGATTAAYGSPYVFRVDVTNNKNQPCAPSSSGTPVYSCPTGQVTVTANGSPIPPAYEQGAPPSSIPGTYTLNSQGYLDDAFIQFPAGSYNLAASYAGDTSFNASVSPSVPVTITPGSTTTTISAPASVVGTTVNFAITVDTRSFGVGPTGTVQFFVGGSPLGGPLWIFGTAYSSASGNYAVANATLNLYLPVGTNTITAQYSGDSNYAGSTSAAITVAVADYTVSADPSTMNISAPGQSGTTKISVTPLGGFTANVSLSCFTSDASLGCTVSPSSITLNGSSAATATLTVNTTGQASGTPSKPQVRIPPNIRPIFIWPWLLIVLLALGTLLSLATARLRAAGLLCASAILIGVWVACGGGGGAPPAPAPGVGLSTTNLTFGNQILGTTSQPQAVTISNTGSALLTIQGISIAGLNGSDFSGWNGCDSTPNLAPGANCQVKVTFTAMATGTRSASLSFSDNAAGSPQTVSLTGTGVRPPTAPGSYSVSILATSGSVTRGMAIPVTVQ